MFSLDNFSNTLQLDGDLCPFYLQTKKERNLPPKKINTISDVLNKWESQYNKLIVVEGRGLPNVSTGFYLNFNYKPTTRNAFIIRIRQFLKKNPHV